MKDREICHRILIVGSCIIVLLAIFFYVNKPKLDSDAGGSARHSNEQARVAGEFSGDVKYNRMVDVYEREYPQLNPKSPQYDQKLVDRISVRVDELTKGGVPSEVALSSAVRSTFAAESYESLNLVCSDNEGYAVNISVDEKINTIKVDGMAAEDVRIGKDVFLFKVRMSGDWWYYSINRTTRMLLVHRLNRVAPPPYRCRLRQVQF